LKDLQNSRKVDGTFHRKAVDLARAHRVGQWIIRDLVAKLGALMDPTERHWAYLVIRELGKGVKEARDVLERALLEEKNEWAKYALVKDP